jgi:hypothetical protein
MSDFPQDENPLQHNGYAEIGLGGSTESVTLWASEYDYHQRSR